jgi:hypothetical protein|uniref:Uncharacterized protein n=2 Tax=Oryza TaxID=4527 RepID=A0A0E0NUE5_ORYRU
MHVHRSSIQFLSEFFRDIAHGLDRVIAASSVRHARCHPRPVGGA